MQIARRKARLLLMRSTPEKCCDCFALRLIARTAEPSRFDVIARLGINGPSNGSSLPLKGEEPGLHLSSCRAAYSIQTIEDDPTQPNARDVFRQLIALHQSLMSLTSSDRETRQLRPICKGSPFSVHDLSGRRGRHRNARGTKERIAKRNDTIRRLNLSLPALAREKI